MGKKTASKNSNETYTYYGFVYGGIIKQGFVSFFKLDTDPKDGHDQFKTQYGSRVQGRYVKVKSDSPDYLAEILEKFKEVLNFGTICETSIDTAASALKEATKLDKSQKFGDKKETGEKEAKEETGEDKEDDKPKKKDVKKTKTKKEEEKPVEDKDDDKEDKDDGDEDNEPSDAEETGEDKEEEKPVETKKKTADKKKQAKK